MEEKRYFDMVSRQSNQFIESPFAQEFSEQELKTMEFVISQIKKSDIALVNNNQVKIITKSVQEFSQMIGAHPDDIYKRANLLSESLMNKKIRCKFLDSKGNEGFIKHSFFTSMAYKDGFLSIAINPFVLSYFIDIADNFTEFRLENVLRIGSSYGIKLYKLLKQYENTIQKYRKLDIIELRNQFGISEEKYVRYNNFKVSVIDVSVKHINEHTDILVNYIEKKQGRKVSSLVFHIKSKINQYNQALLIFENMMNNLPDGQNLKHFWEMERKDHKARIKRFMPCFRTWLENACRNYSAESTDLVEIETENSLFYDKNEIMFLMEKALLKKNN